MKSVLWGLGVFSLLANCTSQAPNDEKSNTTDSLEAKDSPTMAVAEVANPLADVSQMERDQNPIKALVLELSLTCDSSLEIINKASARRKKGEKFTPEETAEYHISTIKQTQCAQEVSKKPVIVAIGPTETKSYTVERAEDYVKLCEAAAKLTGVTLTASGAVAAGGAARAYGSGVTCPSGAETIAKGQGPMVILAPNLVQGRYLTKQVLMSIKLYDDAKKVGQPVEKFVKEHAADVAAASLMGPAVIADKITGGEVGRAARNLDDDLDVSENVDSVKAEGKRTFKRIFSCC